MQLIIITPETTMVNETGIINQLFLNGMQRLHLRKPSFTLPDYADYIRSVHVCYHSRIVVHGCYGLFSALGLGGIHLSSAARNNGTVGKEIMHIPPRFISTSFHAWQEVEENDVAYGYVFISPVFDSISKKGYKAGISLGGAVEIKRKFALAAKYCPPVIGLGGIAAPQIGLLQQHGFDGAAILGSIWAATDPVRPFVAINNKVAALNLTNL